MDPQDEQEGKIEKVIQKVKELSADLLDFDKAFSSAFQNMTTLSTDLNKTFTQGRERITEMNLAVAQAGPAVIRLGGEVSDAGKTLMEVSIATRRNVIASTQDVAKLYSAAQLLEESVGSIVGEFQDVGVQFSQVGKQLETSINYVRSIGGNAGQIMREVTRYMDAMNRYNFSEGVLGLTKMATQASLLRFDMQQTLSLTDKVMDPEGAIEIASAFQRLGVMAGDLVDPYQLMNKSINDPQGLQDSIVNISKQFSYFDEKSKTFRINPQGILMLKEIEKQTGLSAREMSKLAVNAADLDQKLGSLSPSLEFKNPEDKMYLANIAKMGEGGEYEVKINDKETKKLGEITQSELNKLIEEQKKGPKSLEDLTRDQLDFTKLLYSDLRAVRDKVVYGMTSAEIIRKELEGMRRASTTATGVLSESVDQQAITDVVDQTIKSFEGTVNDILSGNFEGNIEKVLGDVGKFLEKNYQSLGDWQVNTLQEIIGKMGNTTHSEKGLLEYILQPIQDTNKKTAKASSDKIDGSKSKTSSMSTKNVNEDITTVEIGGNGQPIVFKFDVPPGMTEESFKKFIGGKSFEEKVSGWVIDELIERGYIKKR